ncbi:MAG: polysaccharide biosynthesis protein, partial [Nitrosomonas europaea]
MLDNLVSLAIVRGLDYLVPLITLPYLVRVLGIEGFGLVNYALSFALYFSAVMQYGFTITAVRKIAQNRDNPEEIAVIYSETITATMLLIVASALVYFPIVLFVSDFYQHF